MGACVIECLVFVYQYWHLPGVDYWEFAWRRGTRPYGIFQQVNLLASFTACGVLLSATLFLRLRDGYRIVIGVGLVMMGFVLHESQSQTGYLSLVVGEVLLLAVFPAQRRTLLLLLLPLASGMAAGSLVRHFLSVATVDHFTTSQCAGRYSKRRWHYLPNARGRGGAWAVLPPCFSNVRDRWG